jgi:hypothetical protein
VGAAASVAIVPLPAVTGATAAAIHSICRKAVEAMTMAEALLVHQCWKIVFVFWLLFTIKLLLKLSQVSEAFSQSAIARATRSNLAIG